MLLEGDHYYRFFDALTHMATSNHTRISTTLTDVIATIDEFTEFCKLLAQPENRIKGRYVNTRTEADMVNEMARELVNLPIYVAYTRVRQERDGEQSLLKGKIRTIKLPALWIEAAQAAFERNRETVEENSRRYLKPRDQIRLEIEERQERW